MANYGKGITPEVLKARLKEEQERHKERLKALEVRIVGLEQRKKSVADLKAWMARRKLIPADVFWMLVQLRPKRADQPVKSKKALHPEVQAARGPTARRSGLGSRGGKDLIVKGDPAFMAAIKKARIAKGWDGEQMGKKVGVSGASISNWEAGRYTPKEEARVKILKVLDLPSGLGAEAVKAAEARVAHGSNGAAAPH